MFKRIPTPRETEFLSKLRELFLDFNAMIYCNDDNEICIGVDVDDSHDWSMDLSFNEFFDDTDIDELFEEYNRELN